jgi:hypothetical protein
VVLRAAERHYWLTVANERQANFISVKGPELLRKVHKFSRTIPEMEVADMFNLVLVLVLVAIAWCSMLVRVSTRSVRYLRERTPPPMHNLFRPTRLTHSKTRRHSLRILHARRQHSPNRIRRTRSTLRRLRPPSDQPADKTCSTQPCVDQEDWMNCYTSTCLRPRSALRSLVRS